MDNRYLKYEKLSYYNPKKVLIGPWVEERASYKKSLFKHESVYKADFLETHNLKNTNNSLWRNRVRGTGLDPHILNHCGGAVYDENFSTTCDLSYQQIPKWTKETGKNKKYKDLLNPFGNVTEYGLLQYKKNEWANDTFDPRKTFRSVYKGTFLPIAPDVYKKKVDVPNWRMYQCDPLSWECKLTQAACGSLKD